MAKFDDRVSQPENTDHPNMPANSSSEEKTASQGENFLATIGLILLFTFPLIGPSSSLLLGTSSMFYALLDPLFLYVPLINEDTKCVMLDNKLKIAAIVLRSFGDIRYVLRILVRIKEGWNGQIGLKKIAMSSAMDTLSVLPIPQVAVLSFLPKMRGLRSLKIMKLLNSLILLQYLARVYPIYKFCKETNENNLGQKIPKQLDIKGIKHLFPHQKEGPVPIIFFLSRKGNLILANIYAYLLASHVLGAFWYFFSIQREIDCWGYACRMENGCEFSTSCDVNTFRNITLLNSLCPINPPDATIFDFGIFLYALQSGMQGSTNFSQKLLQCFSWGLRNLSSFASNLNTSTYGWENFFVIVISICGLILFIYLLGHVQTFMQVDKFRLDSFHRKIEQIESRVHSLLSVYQLSNQDHKLESKIKLVVEQKLKEDENFIVENMFSILSLDFSKVEAAKDLATKIKCSLFMDKLKKVDGFRYNNEEEVLRPLCEALQPVIYNEGTYIIREGEPLDKLFFVTQGSVLIYATNNGGLNGSSSAGTIQYEKEKDGLYGRELLQNWANDVSNWASLSELPISHKTVKCLTKAEVFALNPTILHHIITRYQSDEDRVWLEIRS